MCATFWTLKHRIVDPVTKSRTVRMTVSPDIPNVGYEKPMIPKWFRGQITMDPVSKKRTMRMTVSPDTPDVQCGRPYVTTDDDPTTQPTASNEGLPLEYRMAAVVDRYWDRYHDQVAGGEGHTESGIENEEMSSLTERLSRLPTIMDPSMWKVRVQVSLSITSQNPILTRF